jgi:hypothetical protein
VLRTQARTHSPPLLVPRYASVSRKLWSDEALHRLRIDPRVIGIFSYFGTACALSA